MHRKIREGSLLMATLGVLKDNDGDELPTYLLESAWEGMTYVESRKD